MLSRTLAVALAATAVGVASGVAPVGAQSVQEFGQPKELPPASYKSAQYIDSRGCVFVRAGYSGRVIWVPRVSRDRKVICGYPPSLGGSGGSAVAAAPVAGPPMTTAAAAPPRATAPVRAEPAPGPAPAPMRVAAPAPAPVPEAAPAARLAAVFTGRSVDAARLEGTAACPAVSGSVPLYRLSDGREAVRCSATQGTFLIAVYGAAPAPVPEMAPPAPVVRYAEATAPLPAPVAASPVAGARVEGGMVILADGTRVYGQPTYGLPDAGVPRGGSRGAMRTAAADAIPAPPPGYRLAWTDGRLNPDRAKGTAQGEAAMNMVWTQTVPARLIADASPRAAAPTPVAYAPAPGIRMSTSGGPAPARTPAPAQAVGRYVQVGAFGEPANAAGAVARLQALGLPVRTGTISRGGRALQVVMAGPFASAADLGSALGAARGAGFPDAFTRN